MTRPIIARIDTGAFRHNYLLAQALAPKSKAWAVVKANAYGHGLLRCAEAVRDVADGFALLEISEAMQLRDAGFKQPIVLLEGFFAEDDLQMAAEHAICATVHCEDQLRLLELSEFSRPLDVFVKLNSGMNRLGFSLDKLSGVLDRLRASNKVGQVVLMTHFSCADGEGIAPQLARFEAVAAPTGLPMSLANSAALLRYPESHHAWVRPGIMLYGGSPVPDTEAAESIGLKPVMTLSSRIIGVQDLLSGDAVGYSASFVADRPMRVGTVACGYADGYPRHAGTGTPILVNGQRTRTLGRVSMDMLACDLTGVDAGIGAPVTLWGQGMPADDVAAAARTVSYELFCALAQRVPVVEY
jgi:alanine racemase